MDIAMDIRFERNRYMDLSYYYYYFFFQQKLKMIKP